MKEHNVHLNHIDGTSNLLVQVLSRTPRLDDAEACDYNNNIACAKICCTVNNEAPFSQPRFALNLGNISNLRAKCAVVLGVTSTSQV